MGTMGDIGCRIESSGRSVVVIFHHGDGEELFLLPADRLDPATLEKLRSNGARCDVQGPAKDGTSALFIRSLEGDVLFEQKVWIRAGALGRRIPPPAQSR